MQINKVHIESPKYKILNLKNFPLNQIPTYFKIADFERKKTATHISKIIRSIKENKFYDNVIRVIKKAGLVYVVDGQHRLAALYNLHQMTGLPTYDLIVIEYETSESRDVYRKINIGMRLGVAHHLKAIDDGSIPFFNELRDVLSHESIISKLTFKEAIDCLSFTKFHYKSIAVWNLEKVLSSITKGDIEFIRVFADAMIRNTPTRLRGIIFRPMFIKPLFAACYRKKLNILGVLRMIDFGKSNKSITDTLADISTANYNRVTSIFMEHDVNA